MRVRNCHEKIWQETCENVELLQDWLQGSNRIVAGICSVKDCSKPAEFGGCVEILSADDNDLLNLRSGKENAYFLIPLCKDCIKLFGEEYEVKKGTYPVSSDRVFCEPLRNDGINDG